MLARQVVLYGMVWCVLGAVCWAKPVELKAYRPEGGRCSFVTPGGKKPVTSSYSQGEGAAKATVSLFCYDQPGCRCQVRYFDLPATQTGLAVPELLGTYCFPAWGDVKRLGKPQDVAAGEQRGVEYHLNDTRSSWIRVFRAGQRVYVLSATSPPEKSKDAEPAAAAFLGSFRILEANSSER